MNLQVGRDLRLNTLKLLATFGIHQRHDHFQIRVGLAQNLCRFQEICAEHFHFGAAATRQ
ncbi:hypothetical protein D3C87_1995870 [compost metagenome]